MKKILFISSLYYPNIGGIETMIKELSQQYRKIDIESICLTKKWPVNLVDEEEFDGTKIYRVPSARTEDEFVSIINWIKSNEEKIKADIIHVIGIRRPLPLIALLLSRHWGVPIICTIAGGDVPDNFDPAPMSVWNEGKDFIPDVLMQSDSVNCVSKALVGDLKKVMPKLTNIKTLYAGLDLSIVKNSKIEKLANNYIFCFRRLDPSKGVDILIKAFNCIKDKFPDLSLVIAGEGSEEQKLKELVESLKLNDQVMFIGSVSLSRGISLLKGACLTVVPSLSEGGGLVNIEAQASGCPVIASNVGGIPEYVSDGESGLLFEPGNFIELSEKITLLLNDKELQKKLVRGGIIHVQKFDWNTLVPQYLELYRDLISNYDKTRKFKSWSPLTKKLWDNLIN